MAGKKTTSKKPVKEVKEAKQIDHVLVPPVELVEENELAQLFTKLGFTKDKLPLIKSNDPAIAFLHLIPGQVVKFVRVSLVSGGKVLYYRLVVGE